MYYLYLNIGLCILYALLRPSKRWDKRTKRVMYMLMFVQLVVFHSFIDIDGWVDLPEYADYYSYVASVSIQDMLSTEIFREPLFYSLMKICSFVSKNFIFFLCVNSILIILFYFITLDRYSDYKIMSIIFLLITVYNPSLSILRQGLALALITLSYKTIIEKKLFLYILIIILAFFIHHSSIVFLPVYFIYNIEKKLNFFVAILLIAIALSVGLNALGSLTGLAFIDEYSMHYMQGAGVIINSTRLFIVLVIFVTYIVVLRDHVFEVGINKLLFTLLIIGVIASFFGTGMEQSDRLFQYYTTCSFLAIPKIYSYLKGGLKPVFAVVSFIAFFYLAFHGNDYLASLKYIF